MPPHFSNKTLSFLRALERNNDRAWFHSHRDDYEAHVREPMAAIVAQLAFDLRPIAPDLAIDPQRSLFRPWRDTRFSEDKRPLKTHVAAVFPHRKLGRMSGAGLYFELARTHAWIGGGMYRPDTAQLHAVREHIAVHFREFHRIVTTPAFKRLGGLQGETTSRMPRGFPGDHPAADYLRYKQFLGFREEPPQFATTPTFYRNLLATLTTLVPLVRFLNEPLLQRASWDARD